ncbi:hypothetical protein [Hoyosella altamirensis]|uniref:Uncharacterized protein n=1 Tax=Hoyosella altamirensis TaxID=616997 RepID=A0A839RL84_9ACTN|nr:hypothetical protein [Hoyosella altamirensis]MBB3037137.1 hypothetical protein [Hoyosella altamirensis]
MTTVERPAVNTTRVWLAAPLCRAPEPSDRPVVRDDLMRTWVPAVGAVYCSADGRHRATWQQLRVQHDLVEVRTR